MIVTIEWRMPEYRLDPLTGRMVIVAEGRSARPYQFDINSNSNVSHDTCPFCEGNESLTPGEIAAFRHIDSAPNTPGWRVRAVPNKYPAVVLASGKFLSEEQKDIFLESGGKADGLGLHEVIIDTPRHVVSVSELTPAEVADMLSMYRHRLQTLRHHSSWTYVQIFKNVGAAAGASLPHSHSQLVALPFVPAPLLKMFQNPLEKQRCLWCERLSNERQDGNRMIEETEHFVVLCPFVSRFAGEMEIYPKKHESGFDQLDDSVLVELAELFRRSIIRLEKVVYWLKTPSAYNTVLHTEPLRFRESVSHSFHWHFSILPSLTRAAGFEWGTGLHINPTPPEKAAGLLRESLDMQSNDL